MSLLLKILYWVAVIAVSVGLVIALITFLESRDRSSVGADAGPGLTLLS